MEALLWAVLAAWFVLTAAAQVSARLRRWVRGHDPLHLVPQWNFFAPTPGDLDFHLLYRDVSDERTGPWTEVQQERCRPLLGAVWNPAKRGNKAVVDLCQRLAAEITEAPAGHAPAMVMLTVPYLLLLNHVMGFDRGPGVLGRQFLLMTSGGADATRPATPMFVSATHPFDEGARDQRPRVA